MTPTITHTNLYINGEYVPSVKGETLSIYSPNDDSLVTDKIQAGSEADVDKAVAAAKAVFPAWRNTAGSERGRLMLRFADLLEASTERMAELESVAMGQPVSVAKKAIAGGLSVWRYYAGWAGKIRGDSFMPTEADGSYKLVQYEPLGVCAGICAWNGSHGLAAWKLAPALAAGNTYVLKPSEKSPLALLEYGRLFAEAGFPPGVVNIVPGAGPTGSAIASHMDIAKVAFTGSAAVGRAVMKAAAASNLKTVTLELGGKSPALVFADADLANAVQHTSAGFLRNSGQVCFASSRVLVHESVADEYVRGVKAAFEAARLQMAHSLRPETVYGPVADRKQFDRIMGFLDHAKAEGTQVLAGGGRLGGQGTFIEPTVFLNPNLGSRVYREEIFGPVLSINTFRDEDEAVRLANDTSYGLGSSVYTSDLGRALRVADKMDAGTVGINGVFITSAQTPFGGFKQSGTGKESGEEGLRAYLRAKTIHINMHPLSSAKQ
ncbi:Aldedh domain-containing protein [Trichoderma simmonsii]|uniref:aldehyde dehydrogenase (NAD(+)) n=1 Tax=Trichoderma simmonsii TaxID=1491479 RepID=A0A8G0PKI8_9HYPO|nr:Aldedh domain-containing protein [Trichoderma simmonsii]